MARGRGRLQQVKPHSTEVVMSKQAGEEVAVPMRMEDLMAPAEAPGSTEDEAGRGSESIGRADVILPRISLLQGLSKAVANEEDGAKPGLWWATPHNRPVTLEVGQPAKFVISRLYRAQRLWTPIDEGGGLICEAADGDLIAREPLGLTGAKLVVEIDKKSGRVKEVDWEGGTPTDDCSICVYGPGAADAAAGRKPTGKGNPWLPKMVEHDGETHKVPDDLRAPRCTNSLDVLAFVMMPAFGDLPAEIVPAFISFAKTSQVAGRALAGMIKLAVREPAWAKIILLDARQVTNAKGTFYIATVKQHGYARRALMDMAAKLYGDSKEQSYTADVSDGEDSYAAPTDDAGQGAKRDDDAAAPDDVL